MKKIIFLTSTVMFLINISVHLLDYFSFNFNAVLHEGRPKMAVTTTPYDIIASRCGPQIKHIWRYFLFSKCDCHNFNSLKVMKGGGGGGVPFLDWVNTFIFLCNVIKGIMQGNTRRKRVFPNKKRSFFEFSHTEHKDGNQAERVSANFNETFVTFS